MAGTLVAHPDKHRTTTSPGTASARVAADKRPVARGGAPRQRVRGHAGPWPLLRSLPGLGLGVALVLLPMLPGPSRDLGLQAAGPLAGVAIVVLSLFGDVPRWGTWLQRGSSWLFPGVLLATALLLVPLLIPTAEHESSFLAISPFVWLAYIPIVLVGVSFGQSSLPFKMYRSVSRSSLPPAILVPCCVVVFGLLGNVFDGVSIIAVSSVIFLSLLPRPWALRASFALLFGGLVSNMVTVAAEPTNIKFQDVLQPVLDRVRPSFWLTNWPISLVGIAVPALVLMAWMHHDHVVRWASPSAVKRGGVLVRPKAGVPSHDRLTVAALALLAAGIIAHTIIGAVPAWQATITAAIHVDVSGLYLFVLPAGLVAAWHVFGYRRTAAWTSIKGDAPTWIKLTVIFALLWYLTNGPAQAHDAFAGFFSWSGPLRFGAMVALSLLSAVTDNVALAAMQGNLILNHPLRIWQVRFLFVLLTWAGGLTPFGCLQSLALNSRLKLSAGAWIKEAGPWAAVSLAAALCGLGVTLIVTT